MTSEARTSLADLKRGLALGTEHWVLLADATDDDAAAFAKTMGWDEYEVTRDGAGVQVRPVTEENNDD